MVVTYKVHLDGNGVDVTQTVDNGSVPGGGGPDVTGPPSGAGPDVTGPPPGAGNGQTYTLAQPPSPDHPDGCDCGCGCEAVVIFGPTVIRGGGKSGKCQESDSSMPDISFRALNFTLDEQVASQWCWAAVTAGVRNFYSIAGAPKVLQCQVATEILARATTLCRTISKGSALIPAALREPPAVSHDNNLPEPLDLARYHVLAAINPNPFSNALSFARVAAEIDAGRPVVVRIGWEPDASKGHYIVISGYGRKNSVDYLYVQDPEGFSAFAPYAWVLSNYYLQNTATGAASLGYWSWTYMLAPHNAAPMPITPPSSLLGAPSGGGLTVPVDLMGLSDIAAGRGIGFAHPGAPLTLSSDSQTLFTAGNRVAISGELVKSAVQALNHFSRPEPRYLRIPGLSLHALWANNGKTDIVYPFATFDPAIEQRVTPLAAFFESLQGWATKVSRFDDRPSANTGLYAARAAAEPKAAAKTSAAKTSTPRRPKAPKR